MKITNKERVNMLTKRLGGLDSRLLTNWILTDVRASKSMDGSYVRLTFDNMNGVIFFDDIRELERIIKAKVHGAYNFAVMKTSPSKPQISFCA